MLSNFPLWYPFAFAKRLYFLKMKLQKENSLMTKLQAHIKSHLKHSNLTLIYFETDFCKLSSVV